jgi:hypothetical protein
MPGAMAAPTDGFEVAGIVGFRRRSAENVVNLLRGRPAVHTAASGAPEHEFACPAPRPTPLPTMARTARALRGHAADQARLQSHPSSLT